MPDFVGWMTFGESVATYIVIMCVLLLVIVNLLYCVWATRRWWNLFPLVKAKFKKAVKCLGTESHINWWNN